MEKKKGFLAIIITAALLFLAQGCYFGFDHHGYHGYHGGWEHHGGYHHW